jgi:hypothetical protein
VSVRDKDGYFPQWDRTEDLDEPCRTIQGTSADGGARPPAIPVEAFVPDLSVLDQPFVTVCATEDKGARHQRNREEGRTPMRASDALLRAVGRRRLEVHECAVVQDFPADWPFTGPRKSDRYALVGNAVPRRLAAAVAGPIVAHLRATVGVRYRPAGEAVCLVCGAPATCFGQYEGRGPVRYACDECCGHGNEDGWCEQLQEVA